MKIEEDQIKSILETFFQKHGWNVQTKMGRDPGADVEAHRDNDCWKIEVKPSYAGDGTDKNVLYSSQGNYFDVVLGEILRRMEDSKTHYAIAFPDEEKYKRLWKENLPQEAKKRTKIFMFIVDVGDPSTNKPSTIDVKSWSDGDIDVPSPFKNFGINQV